MQVERFEPVRTCARLLLPTKPRTFFKDADNIALADNTMNPDEAIYVSANLVERLRALAERHDHVLRSKLEAPATTAALDRMEYAIGSRLAPSFRSFLSFHNGLSFQFCRSVDVIAHAFPLARYEFRIFGTEWLERLSADYRTYVDGMDVADAETLRLAQRCIDFASPFSASDLRILYSPDKPYPGGEYPIFFADLLELGFLDTLAGNDERCIITTSFREYFEKSIDFMLSTERGFTYWVDGITDLYLW